VGQTQHRMDSTAYQMDLDFWKVHQLLSSSFPEDVIFGNGARSAEYSFSRIDQLSVDGRRVLLVNWIGILLFALSHSSPSPQREPASQQLHDRMNLYATRREF
jgi:hypothetical protein